MASPKFVGSIDQGTSSTRFCILNHAGELIAQHQLEHSQHYPRPGWVEHDPMEIWHNTVKCAEGALKKAGITAKDLAAVGVTNQRETTVIWDSVTGLPYHNAVVWNCARTRELASTFSAKLGGMDALRAKTGLPIVSYFSALKIAWLLDAVPGLRAKADSGQALFGTIDSWLVWNLSGGAQGAKGSSTVHVTDVTNASRTLLFNLHTCDWDDALLRAFNIPRAMLPTVKSSSEVYCFVDESKCSPLAGVKVAGILGDQQAALFGQTCFKSGDAKCTYGTGCFIMMNTGLAPMASTHGLLTTLAYQLGSRGPPVYALEGAVMVCGSLVQWLRDQLRVIDAAKDTEALALACGAGGAEGVFFVPAFAGLFAPHWEEDARGTVCGLTAFHEKKHLVKAALDAACFQALEVLEAMEQDSGVKLGSMKVDGGMTANEPLLQFQADVANTKVSRPVIAETTAVGAAYAAGLAVGFWRDTTELGAKWQESKSWAPGMGAKERATLLKGWRKAVGRAKHWVENDDATDATADSMADPKARTKALADNIARGTQRGETFFDDDEELNWGEPGFKRQELRKKIKALDKAIDEGIDKVTAPFRKVNPLLLLAAGVAGGMAATRYLIYKK